jgi:hypothetical protein
MNVSQKNEIFDSRLVQEKFPLFLERFTLMYYSSFVLGFLISFYMNSNPVFLNNEKCDSLYYWNIACFFFCLLSIIFVFILKWLRKTLDVSPLKITIFRIKVLFLFSVSFILGLSLNRFNQDYKECRLFSIIDMIFICSESVISLFLILILLYSVYFYYFYTPKPKQIPLPQKPPENKREKNFELLPIDSFKDDD